MASEVGSIQGQAFLYRSPVEHHPLSATEVTHTDSTFQRELQKDKAPILDDKVAEAVPAHNTHVCTRELEVEEAAVYTIQTRTSDLGKTWSAREAA